MAVVEVGEESGVHRFPAEGLTRDEVGSRDVQPGRVGEKPEVRQHLVCRHAAGGQAEMVADALGDFAERDALVRDAVPAPARRAVCIGCAAASSSSVRVCDMSGR